MGTYSTSEIAKIFRIHPNTVMLYEKWGYIAPVERKENGYRVYNDTHLRQIKLVRIALKSELIKCYMKFEVKSIIRSAAQGDLRKTLKLSKEYLKHIKHEKNNELKVVKLIEEVLKADTESLEPVSLSRSNAADLLGVSINVIINWERNGMLEVPRNNRNGYRVYTEKEIKRLRIIKLLRQENYSTQCVRRMLDKLKDDVLPEDGLLSSIAGAEKDVKELISYIKELINNYKSCDQEDEYTL